MKIAMAGDHAGFAMKAALKKRLESQGHEVVDFGPFSEEGCDLPDFIYPAALAVSGSRWWWTSPLSFRRSRTT